MRLLDPSHPFYRPAWRRYLLVGATFGWALLELSFDNMIWACLFAGIGGYLGWHLIVRWQGGDEK
jgi:hypothetical protein